MAENKKSFLLYCDLIHTVSKMPKEKAGELFVHILQYVNDENPITEDLIIQLTFEPIKQSLKRDLQKYENIRQKNIENANKRWNKENATECDRIQPNTKNAVSVSDSVNVINIQPAVDWDALLLAFNNLTKRNFKLIPEKAKRQILARLKEGYDKSDLWNAIENCYNDEYHKETNHKYLTLEFISRPDKMEKYSVDVFKQKQQKVNIEL